MAARSPSFWLLLAVVVVTAIMVHPSFAALFTVPVDLGLLVLLRWSARREGRLEERAFPQAPFRLARPAPERL